MTTDPWDTFVTGDWMRFETPGDTVTGELIARQTGTDYNGDPCPQIVLATRTGAVTITAGQAHLKRLLAAARHELVEGATVTVTFDRLGDAEKGKNPPKLFKVSVTAPDPAKQPAPAGWEEDTF